jgi:Ca-activated chloride channel family protein
VALAEGAPTLDQDVEVRWDVTPVGPDGSPTGDTAIDYRGRIDRSAEPGRYRVVVRRGEAMAETFVDVTADAVTEREVVLDAGVLKLSVKRAEDAAETDPSARIDVRYRGGTTTAYGDHTFTVPAGDVAVTGTVSEATAEETIALAPGETVERTIVVGTGHVIGNAVYSDAGPAYEGGDIRFDVVSAKKDLEGNRRGFGTGYGQGASFDIPPGDYALVAKLGEATAERPFSVKAGEQAEVVVNLNAGVLAVSAPGYSRIDILEARTDLEGDRKRIATAYGETHQTTLPPGDYLVRASNEAGDQVREKAATVKSAERTEIAVE